MKCRSASIALSFASAIGFTPPAAAESDLLAGLVGHYRAASNQTEPAVGALAVSRYDPIELLIERSDGDLVVRLAGPLQAEIVYADDGSNFHLIEHTAGPEIASEVGFLRVGMNGAMAQRSLIASDGQQRHLRLFLQPARWGAARHGLRLDLLTSDGNSALALLAARWLEAVPER
jgi:hypothetical protein